MLPLDIVSRVLHVLTAIVLLGGSAFMLLVVLPVLRSDNQTPSAELLTGLRNRWKRFVHPGILVFLVTGFYNYFRAMPNHKGDGLYHALVGTKIILAFAVFFLASALVGRSAAFEGMRKNSPKWLSILCLLGLVIVAISGFVKVKSGMVQ
jgi:uncharacterized membrane protein